MIRLGKWPQDFPSGLALAFLCGLFLHIGRCSGEQTANMESDKREDRLLAFAAKETQRADSAEAVADSATKVSQAHADTAQRRQTAVVARTDSVRSVPLPPTCDTSCERLIAERDSIIDEYERVANGWRAALAASQEAEAALRSSNASLRLANDSLTFAIKNRPKQIKRCGLGLFTGVSVTRQPTAGAGIVCRVL